MDTCPACGLPSVDGDFCTRAACLTYGSGAIAAGPAIIRTQVAERARQAAAAERHAEQNRRIYFR